MSPSDSSTVLVTGVTGFVGPHLARALRDAGFDVVGWGREPEVPAALAGVLQDYRQVDLVKSAGTIPECRAIVHLAGLAAVGASFERPQSYLADNSAMITGIGEALLATGSRARWLGVSSGAVYGPTSEPLSEQSPVGFPSPYAVSKVLGENQLAYYRGRGLDTVVARPFNHAGPGQGRGFLIPDLIAQVRNALESGAPIRVGDLSTVRDYTDVRDVVRAYVALVTADRLDHGLYNVCSGTGTSGTDILRLVRTALGADALHVETGDLRPSDSPVVVGDASRLRGELGWEPQIPLEQTVGDAVRGA